MRTALLLLVLAAIFICGIENKTTSTEPLAQFDGHAWHCPTGFSVYGVEERAVNQIEPVAVCVKP